MRTRKYFTVREWDRFKSKGSFDMQEMLCQKYDVILTDYQTKREKVFSALKKINLRNFDKGMTEFSKLVQFFGGSMEQLTQEIDSPKRKGSHYKKTKLKAEIEINLTQIGEKLTNLFLFGEILKIILVLNIKTILRKFGVKENEM